MICSVVNYRKTERLQIYQMHTTTSCYHKTSSDSGHNVNDSVEK